MKRTRVIILGGSAAVVVLAAGTAVAATQRDGHTRETALPKADCGSAVTHRLDADTSVSSADPGVLSCFNAAARACSPASIQVGVQGVDAGTTYVFRVDSGGATCRVTELSQSYVAPRRHGPVQSTTCDRTGVTLAGVTLTCDGRNVLIPSTVGPEHPGG